MANHFQTRWPKEFGLVWFGLVWFGLVWFALVCLGLPWFGLVWFGLVWVSNYNSRLEVLFFVTKKMAIGP
jgi:hypothetical protein